MKIVKYILFVVIMLFAFNTQAASNCDSSEFNRLKELAKKIEFSYDYELVDEKAVFSITAVNLNEDLKVIIEKDYLNGNYQEFKYDSTHKATIAGFDSGDTATITIKGYVPNLCSGITVLTKNVKLPYYNYNYDEEKCKGNEEFKYCKILVDSNISKKEFDRQFELFLKNKEEEEVTPTAAPKDNTNIYIIIGASVLLVVISSALISSIVKRRRRNRL